MNGSGTLGSEQRPPSPGYRVMSRDVGLAGERAKERGRARFMVDAELWRRESEEQKLEINDLKKRLAHTEEQLEHANEETSKLNVALAYSESERTEERNKRESTEKNLGVVEQKLADKDRELGVAQKEVRLLKIISPLWWLIKLFALCWDEVWLKLLLPAWTIFSRLLDWAFSVMRTEMNRRADRHEGKESERHRANKEDEIESLI